MAAFVYDLVNVIPFCLTFSVLFYEEKARYMLYLLSIFCAAGCTVLKHVKLRGRAMITGIAAALLFGAALAAGRERTGYFIRENGWLFGAILLCIGCFLIENVLQRYRKGKVIAALAGIVFLIIMIFSERDVRREIPAMILFYALITLAEELQLHWKKEGETSLNAHITNILIFPLSLFIVLILMKVPDRPFDWGFVKDSGQKLLLKAQILLQTLDIQKGWDSDEATIGFSENGSFVAGFTGSPYKALIISSDRENGSRIYLGGKIFDDLDGINWVKRDDSAEDYLTYDMLETMAAVISYDPEHVSDYLRTVNLHITYTGIRTDRVFMPAKALADIADHGVRMTGGDLYFNKGKRDSYRVRYYLINRNYRGFDDLLKSGVMPDKASFEEARKSLVYADKDRYSFEGLKKYEERIEGIYGQKVTVSERMRDYLDRELSGAESDSEKLDRIEDILSGMKYSRNPGNIPGDVSDAADFLDYVVFDTREGYCSHFATAFVLMARAEGIAARYVQGYSVRARGNDVNIMSDRAHAWPEAYIKDIGWIGYEPTPGFKKISGWKASGEREDAYEKSDAGKDYKDRYSSGVDINERDSVPNPDQKSLDLKKVLIPLLAVLSFVILFLIIDRLAVRYRYRRMGERQKAVICGKRTMRLLRLCGIKAMEGETVNEVKGRALQFLPESLLKHTELYEKALYAAGPVTSQEVSQMEEGCRKLAEFVFRQKAGRIFRR